ncbi:MAG: ABC transporter ATP-binding protein [Spirochaetes bacterium]|nr:ABC transporter ATP-binding protein [Spirochaetota bacterium]
MNNIITIEELQKHFTSGHDLLKVIDELNFQVKKGSIVTITGESGVGKSTLLSLIGGLDSVTGGRILIKDTDITKIDEKEMADFRAQNLGFVFQHHFLLPEFTAYENIILPFYVRHNTLPDPVKKYIDDLIREVGLQDRMSHKPGQLSGGECQRTALLRALICRPEIVIADEPTGNLDEKNTLIIFKLISHLNKKYKFTFLVATHNLLIKKYSHYYYVIRKGRLFKK